MDKDQERQAKREELSAKLAREDAEQNEKLRVGIKYYSEWLDLAIHKPKSKVTRRELFQVVYALYQMSSFSEKANSQMHEIMAAWLTELTEDNQATRSLADEIKAHKNFIEKNRDTVEALDALFKKKFDDRMGGFT